MSRTPSRRVLWTLVATVAVVGGTIATSAIIEARRGRAAGDGASDPALPVDIVREAALATSVDQDGDALLDWEENLRGTDPKKPDTDGDGTSDGAEVAAGRDPRVPGPNDTAAEVASSTDAAEDAAYEASRKPGTRTDQFAQWFASNYYDLKADGGFSADDKEALVASFKSAIGEGGLSTTYRADLVPRLTSEDAASLAAYADEFASVHQRELTALAASTDANGYGRGFRSLGKALAAVRTPAALAEAEAKVANAYDTTGSVILLLSAGDDPLASLASMPSLQKAEDLRADASAEIARYLASHGVALQTGKYATFWNKMADASSQ